MLTRNVPRSSGRNAVPGMTSGHGRGPARARRRRWSGRRTGGGPSRRSRRPRAARTRPADRPSRPRTSAGASATSRGPRAPPRPGRRQARPGGLLPDPRRADRHAVEQLAHLPVELRRRDHGPDPVARDGEILGEAVQADQGPGPVRVGEERGAAGPSVLAERAVRLVEDQRDVVPLGHLREARRARPGRRHPARVAGGHQNDRPGPRGDQGLGRSRRGHEVRPRLEVHRHDRRSAAATCRG